MIRSPVVAVLATVVGLAGLVVAVAGGSEPASPASPRIPASDRPATGVVPVSPASPAADPIRDAIKEAATAFVERAGTWAPGGSRAPADRLVAAGYPPDLVPAAGPLLDPAAESSTTTVIYPQMGGLTETTASVIVLARQELRVAEAVSTREVAIDVRVRREAAGWSVTQILQPPRPALPPVRPGGATETGRRLLDERRVALPEPVRDDIVTRRLSDPIMTTVLNLSRRYELQIQVAGSGHPGTVYPRTHKSNHAVGRAVDVRAINGVRVADIARDDPILAAFMADSGRAGATEVGGPITLPGRGLFTDAVHQDHIHLGISSGKPPAAVTGR